MGLLLRRRREGTERGKWRGKLERKGKAGNRGPAPLSQIPGSAPESYTQIQFRTQHFLGGELRAEITLRPLLFHSQETVSHSTADAGARLRRCNSPTDPSVTLLVVGMVSLFLVCQLPDFCLRLIETVSQLVVGKFPPRKVGAWFRISKSTKNKNRSVPTILSLWFFMRSLSWWGWNQTGVHLPPTTSTRQPTLCWRSTLQPTVSSTASPDAGCVLIECIV